MIPSNVLSTEECVRKVKGWILRFPKGEALGFPGRASFIVWDSVDQKQSCSLPGPSLKLQSPVASHHSMPPQSPPQWLVLPMVPFLCASPWSPLYLDAADLGLLSDLGVVSARADCVHADRVGFRRGPGWSVRLRTMGTLNMDPSQGRGELLKAASCGKEQRPGTGEDNEN